MASIRSMVRYAAKPRAFCEVYGLLIVNIINRHAGHLRRFTSPNRARNNTIASCFIVLSTLGEGSRMQRGGRRHQSAKGQSLDHTRRFSPFNLWTRKRKKSRMGFCSLWSAVQKARAQRYECRDVSCRQNSLQTAERIKGKPVPLWLLRYGHVTKWFYKLSELTL